MRHLKADLLLELGKYETLQALCETILDERDVAWAAHLLGECHSRQGHHNLAKEAYLETLELNSDFVTAYDSLACSHLALGSPEEAEQVLSQRVKKSPKLLHRQRALADAAHSSGHAEVVRQARRDAVRVRTNSVHRRPRDHAAYARALVDVDRSKDALNVVDGMTRAFPNDAGAALEAFVCKASVCSGLGRETDANQPSIMRWICPRRWQMSVPSLPWS